MNSDMRIGVEQYLAERVDDQLKFYEAAANKAKRQYTRSQITIIVLGLLVPVVVNFPTQWAEDLGIPLAGIVRLLVTVMSLSLAILNGIANFKKHGDLWLSYRMTEELLKHEKFLFLTGAGKYSKEETAFPEFVETTESIISAEHNKFRSLIEEARRPTAQKGTEGAGKG